MTIKVGDKIPSATLHVVGPDGPQATTTEELFSGKRVVLFAVPGAFTPTCSVQHLPGFVEKAEEIKSKGVDSIICLAVNDPFVMGAWGKDQKVENKVQMVADGSGTFTEAMGLTFDLTEKGLGKRSQRYSMLVEDGVVKVLNLEEAGAFEVSGADAMLRAL